MVSSHSQVVVYGMVWWYEFHSTKTIKNVAKQRIDIKRMRQSLL